MRHFHHLDTASRQRLFATPPASFARHADRDTLAMALGATLYLPATRPHLARDLRQQGAAGVMSAVVCLEDAVSDADLPAAQHNATRELSRLNQAEIETLPLVFVRVREPEQIAEVVGDLGGASRVLSGFVLPKFTEQRGSAFLEALIDVRATYGLPLLAMPVIESPETVYSESRVDALGGIQRLLGRHRDLILAVRLGATDLSSAFGLRRDRDLTIYDVRVVAEVIADVVNVLGRVDGTGHVITGPVWEYFANQGRLFKPQLRQTPFESRHATSLRHRLITGAMDGLIREVVLDKANGLIGKTVIHPSHVAAVHALSVVSHEEHSDACDILDEGMVDGGVRASAYGNKMNEAKPHRAWATRTLRRAAAFGVAGADIDVVDLLKAILASDPHS